MSYIFIDCGSHNGDTVKLFLDKFPGAERYEIYCFEPNPYFSGFYENYHFYQQAVWTFDGQITFYVGKNSLSSTIVKEKVLERKRKIKVPCIDFSKWIKENFSITDYIVLKLDIEGAEYKVLRKMIADETIYYVKKLFVDWHARKMNYPMEKHHSLVRKLKEFDLYPKTMCGERGIIK